MFINIYRVPDGILFAAFEQLDTFSFHFKRQFSFRVVISVIMFSFADTVNPADVGLREENVDDDRGYGLSLLNPFNRAPRWAQPITYLDIHESDSFTVMSYSFLYHFIVPLTSHAPSTMDTI